MSSIKVSFEEIMDSTRIRAFVGEALSAVADGSRGLLLVGPRGCGKTMLARRLAIASRMLQLSSVASVVPPFRAPHHTVSMAGMVGSSYHSGEIALAHGGVLFLDETSAFRLTILQQVCCAWADGLVSTHSAHSKDNLSWPAKFLLICTVETDSTDEARRGLEQLELAGLLNKLTPICMD